MRTFFYRVGGIFENEKQKCPLGNRKNHRCPPTLFTKARRVSESHPNFCAPHPYYMTLLRLCLLAFTATDSSFKKASVRRRYFSNIILFVLLSQGLSCHRSFLILANALWSLIRLRSCQHRRREGIVVHFVTYNELNADRSDNCVSADPSMSKLSAINSLAHPIQIE